MIGLLLGMTLAADARAVIDDAGHVVGSVVVAASPSAVLGFLADPRRVAAVHDGGTRVALVGSDGDCLLADYESDSVFSTIAYRVRQCPAPGGYASSLVASDAFDHYVATWRVEPAGSGARLTYTLDSATSMPVPRFVVNRVTRGSVQQLMERLEAHFAAAGA